VSVDLADELVRSILTEHARQLRAVVGSPVLFIVASSGLGTKVILGADLESGNPIASTVEEANALIQAICRRVAEAQPNDAKLYGEGRSS
jgi:hypothetical protein